jgi:hypothetical protein
MTTRDQLHIAEELASDAEPAVSEAWVLWRRARNVAVHAEDSLDEFRERVSRDTRPMTDERLRELLDAGERLRQQRDEANARLYSLAHRYASQWKPAPRY